MKLAARLDGQTSEDAIGRSIRIHMLTYANEMESKGGRGPPLVSMKLAYVGMCIQMLRPIASSDELQMSGIQTHMNYMCIFAYIRPPAPPTPTCQPLGPSGPWDKTYGTWYQKDAQRNSEQNAGSGVPRSPTASQIHAENINHKPYPQLLAGRRKPLDPHFLWPCGPLDPRPPLLQNVMLSFTGGCSVEY